MAHTELNLRERRTIEDMLGTPYRDWIETYADAGYQSVMASVGRMIDAAALRRLRPDFARSARWPHLQARFTTATRLEVGFWDMGLRGG